MKRIVGFDFGLKRIGVAVGNPKFQTAQALTTLAAKEGVPVWNQVHEIIGQWKPAYLVVGLPLSMDGDETDISRNARKFGAQLTEQTNLEVLFVDERLTSVIADQLLEESAAQGKRKQARNKAARDQLAAELILRTHFDEN